MPWTRLDDQFINSPKILSISRDARWLYVAGLVWSVGALTDGVIAPYSLPAFAGDYHPNARKKAVRELVTAGLWETSGDGWLIHDFSEYQPMRKEVEAKREADRVRKASYRESQRVSQRVSQRDTARTDSGRPGPPTRPVPDRELTLSPEASEMAKEWTDQTGITHNPKWVTAMTEPFAAAAAVLSNGQVEGFVTWALAQGCKTPAGLVHFASQWSHEQKTNRVFEPCDGCESRTWLLIDGVSVPCPECRATWGEKEENQ